jgi:hypothetical protein
VERKHAGHRLARPCSLAGVERPEDSYANPAAGVNDPAVFDAGSRGVRPTPRTQTLFIVWRMARFEGTNRSSFLRVRIYPGHFLSVRGRMRTTLSTTGNPEPHGRVVPTVPGARQPRPSRPLGGTGVFQASESRPFLNAGRLERTYVCRKASTSSICAVYTRRDIAG